MSVAEKVGWKVDQYLSHSRFTYGTVSMARLRAFPLYHTEQDQLELSKAAACARSSGGPSSCHDARRAEVSGKRGKWWRYQMLGYESARV